MTGCVFCRVAEGTEQSWIVDEDPWTLAFLDRSQVTAGHTLVIPREHAADIWDISREGMLHVAAMVHRVAGLLRTRLDPQGLTLFQANRPAGWQDVFHLHVHVVPRAPGDRLVQPWTVPRCEPEQLNQTLEIIRGE